MIQFNNEARKTLLEIEDKLDLLYIRLVNWGGVKEFGEKVREIRTQVRAMRDSILLEPYDEKKKRDRTEGKKEPFIFD